jgi:hypothetical protein
MSLCPELGSLDKVAAFAPGRFVARLHWEG